MVDIKEFIENNDFTEKEFFKIMNNYLNAIYTIKQTTLTLKNSVKTIIESRDIQISNAKEFSKIMSLYSNYVTKLKLYIPYLNLKKSK